MMNEAHGMDVWLVAAGGGIPGDPRHPRSEGGTTMFGLGMGILALFSLAGIFSGPADPRRSADPRDDLTYRVWYLLR
jgi:hypothetical protein